MDDLVRNTPNNESDLHDFNIAAVIPSYNVEKEIDGVLQSIPSFVRYIIVVNDGSKDRTHEVVQAAAVTDPRIILLDHSKNQGVGGAMRDGLVKALTYGAQIIVKIDGDGQMPLEYLPSLLRPLILGEADYAKGNRFRDFRALRNMPLARRTGNMILSFLAKAATGYWNCFDPTNGFIAVRGDVLTQIPLEKIHKSYYFEISILSQLYLSGCVVRDIPMPARYANEKSNLSIFQVLREFPARLMISLTKRLVLKNLIYDFNMEAMYLLTGIPMILAGGLYGLYNWILYSRMDASAPTGIVVVPALLLILGFQLLLAAIEIDMHSMPAETLGRGPLQPGVRAAETKQHKGEPFSKDVSLLQS